MYREARCEPGVLSLRIIAPEELAFVSLPFHVTLKMETGVSSLSLIVACTTVLLPLSVTDEARYTSGITASAAWKTRCQQICV